MYKPQNTAVRIKDRAKSTGKTINSVLTARGLGVNTVSKMNNGSDITVESLVKIADELDCSLDYLVGRTDVSEVNRNNKQQIHSTIRSLRTLSDNGREHLKIANKKLGSGSITYRRNTHTTTLTQSKSETHTAHNNNPTTLGRRVKELQGVKYEIIDTVKVK